MGATNGGFPPQVDLNEEPPEKSCQEESEEVDDMQEYVTTFVNSELNKALKPLREENVKNQAKRSYL
jgi:guanylate kinase